MITKINPEILQRIARKKAPYRAMNRRIVALLEADPQNVQLLHEAEWIRQKYLEIIRECEGELL